jgi:hypothetical protein
MRSMQQKLAARTVSQHLFICIIFKNLGCTSNKTVCFHSKDQLLDTLWENKRLHFENHTKPMYTFCKKCRVTER